MPSDRLELALWLESDRMGFLTETIDQKKLDTQREVVRNERRQTTENTPYGRAEVRLIELLYPQPSPYFGAIIGSHEDLQRASLDDVKDFFRTYYGPNNATLAIVGDFQPAEVKPLVEKYFGPLNRGPLTPPISAPRQAPAKAAQETMRDQVQLAKVMMGWVGPPPLERPAISVLTRLLATGKSSRLHHRLVYEQKVAQDVSASWENGMRLGGQIEVTATVQAGHSPQEVTSALAEEIRKLRDEPPTAAELDRVKRGLRSTLFTQLENVGGFGGKADQLNYYELWARDPERFSQHLQAVLAVTPQDVQKVAQEFMRDEQRVLITVLPEERRTP
jgi:zinc protease